LRVCLSLLLDFQNQSTHPCPHTQQTRTRHDGSQR
jgi:hypothetical protein